MSSRIPSLHWVLRYAFGALMFNCLWFDWAEARQPGPLVELDVKAQTGESNGQRLLGYLLSMNDGRLVFQVQTDGQTLVFLANELNALRFVKQSMDELLIKTVPGVSAEPIPGFFDRRMRQRAQRLSDLEFTRYRELILRLQQLDTKEREELLRLRARLQASDPRFYREVRQEAHEAQRAGNLDAYLGQKRAQYLSAHSEEQLRLAVSGIYFARRLQGASIPDIFVDPVFKDVEDENKKALTNELFEELMRLR